MQIAFGKMVQQAGRLADRAVPGRDAHRHGDGRLRGRRSRAPSCWRCSFRSSSRAAATPGRRPSTLVIRALALGEVRSCATGGASCAARCSPAWRSAVDPRRHRVPADHALVGLLGPLRPALAAGRRHGRGRAGRRRAVGHADRLAPSVRSSERLGFDPATSSAPFVATLVDVTGLIIYFSAWRTSSFAGRCYDERAGIRGPVPFRSNLWPRLRHQGCRGGTRAGRPQACGGASGSSGRGLPTSSPSANPAGGLEASSCRPPAQPSRTLLPLTLTALGVVYGDIGTSPLYALRECFFGSHAVPPTHDNVLGVLSLIFWSLADRHLGQVPRVRHARRQPGRGRHPGADRAAAVSAPAAAPAGRCSCCSASSAPRCSTATA